ncbi:hypothetical protein DFJ64_0259 [Thermasporomyces composti]|uniref:Uncharacterized protein n=1 Tax=Thermasporomyces composti TaxID=696763 RepID=A0A3D9V285_THECX|nr:hypothetical protein DFJ64_0259 [Thermasporomyces composti]
MDGGGAGGPAFPGAGGPACDAVPLCLSSSLTGGGADESVVTNRVHCWPSHQRYVSGSPNGSLYQPGAWSCMRSG